MDKEWMEERKNERKDGWKVSVKGGTKERGTCRGWGMEVERKEGRKKK
jgi:hypothetical protein